MQKLNHRLLDTSFLFLLVVVFRRSAKRFLGNVLSFAIEELFDQDWTHSLDTLRYVFLEIVPQVVIHNVCSTRHGLFTVTSIFIIPKRIEHSQKLRNKLARTCERKIQGSNKKLIIIKLISKKV